MHFTLQGSDPQPAIDLLKQEGIEPAFLWQGEYHTFGLREYRDRMRKECVPNDEWCLTVDCDEFQNWHPKEVLRDEYNLVPGIMVDMVAENGILTKMLEKPSLLEQYPNKCFITQKIGQSWIAKIAAMKGHDLEVWGEGGGYTYINPKCETRVLPMIVETFHFKWDDKVKQRMEQRAESYQSLKIGWHHLSTNLANYFDDHDRIQIDACADCQYDSISPEILKKQYGDMYDGTKTLSELRSCYCSIPRDSSGVCM